MIKIQKYIAIAMMFVMVLGGALALTKIAFAASSSVDVGLNFSNELGLGTKDPRQTVAKIINTALGLLGIVAVVIVIVGGFKWMTAGGNEEAVGEAKKWIFSGVIGLAIILSAYALASWAVNSLVNATT